MAGVVTVTVNPALDLSTTVERVQPVHKLRCAGLRRDPGGGGINVARVVHRLGGEVTALYTAGGAIGQLLRRMVAAEGIADVVVPIAAETRENFTVHENATGQQFRFVVVGPELSGAEWEACFDTVAALAPFPDYLVASGSLPPGVPTSFFGELARLARERGARFLLDSSGAPLREALAEGVFLVKPSLTELSGLVGHALETPAEWEPACVRLVADGQAHAVALTLGDRGATLVTEGAIWRAAALPISPVSIVGAGDSFLGGMIHALAVGEPLEVALEWAMAAGAAALLSAGTELCRAADVARLRPLVRIEQVSLSACRD
jgi:6-phosphofructokinase 2